ncbi:hypothetical protein [Microcoleus sp.]
MSQLKKAMGIQQVLLSPNVKEFTILPKNGAFYLEMSYEMEAQQHTLD